MKYYPYMQPIPKDMLEIVDNDDSPLLLTPYKEAKHLPHRFVVLIVRDKEGKFLLWRNKKKKRAMQEAMSLLYSHVHAGEARESVVIRLLEKHLPSLLLVPRMAEELSIMQGITMRLQSFTAPFTGQNPMTLYTLQLTQEEKSLLNKDLLWLDFDEMQGLATHFADMLSPSTQQLIEGKHLHTLYNA